MAVMTCPRCGGCGAILEGDFNTAVGAQRRICPSCGGSGYVTDGASGGGSIQVNIRCPKCGIELKPHICDE